jgi:hypothetical protein
VVAHVKDPDPPHLPRLLRLSGKRREHATGNRVEEGPAADHSIT